MMADMFDFDRDMVADVEGAFGSASDQNLGWNVEGIACMLI